MEDVSRRSPALALLGLGDVGLPLAAEFASAGFRLLRFDVDPEKVARLHRGDFYISDVPGDRVAALVGRGRLRATDDFDLLSEPEALCICVPTPLTETRDPDLSFVITTVEQVAHGLRPRQLVVLESTTYPGTTREEVLPRLEATGMKAGRDFFCGYSPERVNPGSADPPFADVPRLVSGITPACLEATKALYEQIIKRVVPVSSPEVAEMAKLLESVFRAGNISMVNELKMISLRMGIDVWEVIEAAATQPYGFMPFHPGPGLGGHCIPIDPFYLSWRARAFGISARFIELAGEINTQMPRFVLQRVMGALNSHGKALKGSRVLVLGASYKPNVGDTRESPAIAIMELVQAAGAEVRYHDPYVPRLSFVWQATMELASMSSGNRHVSWADGEVTVIEARSHDRPSRDRRSFVAHGVVTAGTRHPVRGLHGCEEEVWLA